MQPPEEPLRLGPWWADRDLVTVSASVKIVARIGPGPVACRGGGRPSVRVHDRYRRRLHDVSCAGRPVLIELEVRRFICDNPARSVATFAEQVDGLTVRQQRRTAAPGGRKTMPASVNGLNCRRWQTSSSTSRNAADYDWQTAMLAVIDQTTGARLTSEWLEQPHPYITVRMPEAAR